MQHAPKGPRARAMTAVLVALLAGLVSLAGCGDDNGDGDNAKADSSSESRPSDDKAQIEWVLDGIQADFDNLDPQAYCAKLTDGGKAKVVQFASQYGHGSTCVKAIGSMARLTAETATKQKPTKLLKVEIYGDQAAATISNGGRKPEGMLFVKQGQEWKIPDPGFGATKRIKPAALEQKLAAQESGGAQ